MHYVDHGFWVARIPAGASMTLSAVGTTPTAELVPVSIDRGVGRLSQRSRSKGYMDGPASLASIPPLAALREARLNGFDGACRTPLRSGSQHTPWGHTP